ALAVICAWAGAEAPPVSRILHALPLFDIALNHRFVYGASFFLAMLAALAVDEADGGLKAAAPRAIIMMVAAALAIAAALVSPGQIRLGVPANLIRVNILAELVPLLAVFVVLAARAPSRTALVAILALLLAQRVREDARIYPTLPPP